MAQLYRRDAFPVTQTTASKHNKDTYWSETITQVVNKSAFKQTMPEKWTAVLPTLKKKVISPVPVCPLDYSKSWVDCDEIFEGVGVAQGPTT